MKTVLGFIFCVALFSCKKNNTDNPAFSMWIKVRAETGLQSNEIVDMIFDKTGNLWAAFAGGVGKYDGKTWTVYKLFPPDPNNANLVNYAQAIMQDKNGNIWVTIENKHTTYACMFDGINWTKTWLTNARIYAITQLPNGEIWFLSTGGGAHILNGNNWSQSDCNGSCNNSYSVFRDNYNNTWIGGGGSSIKKYDGTTFSNMKIPYSEVFGGNIVDISQGPSGDLFASMSPGGAWKFNGTEWQRILDPNYPTGPVLSILEDSKGRIWIGTMGKGVLLFDGSKVSEFNLNGETNYINKILEDKNGVIWLGNNYGLFKYE